jgi:transcriptional antiterminator RfaH
MTRQSTNEPAPRQPRESRRDWYAVICRPRQESRAAWHLRNQEFSVLFPQMRTRVRRQGGWRDRVEPMFPRYLFARPTGDADLAAVRSTRGAVGLVRFAGHLPTVPPELIEAIEAQLDVDECLQAPSADAFQPGDPVLIVDGPFAGVLARFAGQGAEGRVAVLLDIMQRQSRVEIEPGMIRKA